MAHYQVHSVQQTKELSQSNTLTMAKAGTNQPKEPSEVADEKTLAIAVVGYYGDGKSTLVNSLLHMDEPSTDMREIITSGVHCYSKLRDGAKVTIWETHGLGDSAHVSSERVIGELYERAGDDVDLCLFCIAYRIGMRVHDGHRNVIRSLTKCFGISFWKKSCFVLTMANTMTEPKMISALQSNIERNLLQALRNVGVPEDIIRDKQLLLAGMREEPLPVNDGKYEDWNNQLFQCCHNAMTDKTKRKTFEQARYGKSVPAKVGSAIANIGAKTGAAVKGAIAYVTNW
jgi:GTPase SAR1 family protein